MTLDLFLPGLAPSLRETTPPYQSHRPTSVSAARSISDKAPTQANRILDYLKLCGSRGATHLEISEALGLPINVICGRFNSLRKAGLVLPDGTRVNASTNKDAIVWRVA